MMPLTATGKLIIGKDINGVPSYATEYPKLIFNGALYQGVPLRFSTPDEANAYTVLFNYSPGATVWVSLDNPPEGIVPSISGEMQQSNSEGNPRQKTYPAKRWIYVMTDDVYAWVSVAIFAYYPNG